MKRLHASCLLTGCLAALGALAADSSPTLSPTPACTANEIAPELRGVYRGKRDNQDITLALEQNSAVYGENAHLPERAKAWTCQKDRAQVLVIQHEGNRYASRLLMITGQYLVDLGDVNPWNSLERTDFERLAKGDSATFLKKQQR
jgi:hypothetical protein